MLSVLSVTFSIMFCILPNLLVNRNGTEPSNTREEKSQFLIFKVLFPVSRNSFIVLLFLFLGNWWKMRIDTEKLSKKKNYSRSPVLLN